MPKADFGSRLPSERRANFIELKTKGEKVTIRILDKPEYQAIHLWQNVDGSWFKSICTRIMNEEHCEYCDKFFEAKRALKEYKIRKEKGEKLNVPEQSLEKAADGISKKYGAKLTFYYPVLLRSKEEGGILKAGLDIRGKLDQMAVAGVNILNSDFIITRLKADQKDEGKDWFSVIRVDSADTKDFTEKEQEEMAKIEALDIESIVQGGLKQSSQGYGRRVPR